jgi:D-3-phosphoglycerate dehydrogenase
MPNSGAPTEALGRSIVIIADPDIDLAVAAQILAPTGAGVAFAEFGWSGPDVAGIVLSPVNRFTADDAARCPHLRVVVTTSTGYDNIDLAACRDRGIAVWHPTDYCSTEVASSAIAQIVGLLRGMTVLDRSVRAGGWHFADAGVLRRFDETRLGIVGFGTIGAKVARFAQALGMTVGAYDPVREPAAFADAGVRQLELGELFEWATAITVHVPLLESTRGLVSAGLIGRMPPGGVLINLARGEVVDMPAVLDALDSGQLAAAAVDVLATEPPTAGVPAPQHPRLVVTPHAAWYSEQAADILFRKPLRVIRDILISTPVPDLL